MEALFGWIKNITFFLILSGILLQILPDGKYQKYLKFFTGLILVLLVASPLASLFEMDEKLIRAAEQFALEQNRAELKEEVARADKNRVDVLANEYEGLIRAQIEEMVDVKGYSVIECKAELMMDTESEDFGQVLSLDVTLAMEQNGQVIWIEPVEIGGSDQESRVTSADLPEISRELLAQYELEEDALDLKLIER